MPHKPTATYRLQFTPTFGFADAIELVPYLHNLGITHLYASPLLKPVSGSEHGYDVVDPSSLNPELGEEAEFQELLATLDARGMGLILDIVPNHMAVNSQNEWWQDVLERGQRSRFAHFFDIDWERGNGRVVVPTLGDHFGTILENGELKLGIDERGLAVWYYENRFPIDPATYAQVLVVVRNESDDTDRESEPEFETLIDLSSELDADAGSHQEIQRVGSQLGRRVWNLYNSNATVQGLFQGAFEQFNSAPFERLERLLDAQPYRLTFWRRASEEINYRRFFDIADLISLRIEDPEVFDAVHAFLLEYAGTAGLDGFRADHVDGLYDPQTYAERLRRQLDEASNDRGDFLLLFEKILTGHERLPSDWPISGTTGYEFAHRVNAVLADSTGFERIERHYAELTGLGSGFTPVVYEKKARVLDELFAGQFRSLVDELLVIAESERHGRDLSRQQLAVALREVMVRLPRYRTYVRELPVPPRERQVLEHTLDSAISAVRGIENQVWDFLRSALLPGEEDERAGGKLAWLRRWQQFTGPLMAKGLEDTALYVYTPLASLNEVGGEPETLSPEQFHEQNEHVATSWPDTMLTTSTHDTKRSEDVRARIVVLSEQADAWLENLGRWRDENASLRVTIDGIPVPDANEEQLIYQTLLGAWPLDPTEFGAFRERVKAYLTKALREAKVHTSWINVDEAYESAVLAFVDRILDAGPASNFFREFVAFQTHIASYGAWNSLSQLVLKLTSPGFPDIYQGNELWNFSLTDPDNRRPVDYAHRRQLLEQINGAGNDELEPMLHQWRDGRIKLLITSRVLRDRRENREPYDSGEYVPLRIDGNWARHVIAFARRIGDDWTITVVPRLMSVLVSPEEAPVGEAVWGNTTLTLPDDAPSTWVDTITGASVTATDGRLRVAEALSVLPVATLRGENAPLP